MSPLLWIYIITGLAGFTCALAGAYLIIRKSAMIADAISHSILPGLVAGFWIANGPNLLTGLIGALLSGMLTVWLVEYLTGKRRIKQDAAIGLVFPFLFALGVIWISQDFSNVHLDTDSVLFGEVTLAPFDRLKLGGTDLGPQAIWLLSFALIITTAFLTLFRKELKLATFDPLLATVSGFAPIALHYGLMTIVSVSTISAFAAVGAILTVALVIIPAATARLLSHHVSGVLRISSLVGLTTSLLGTWIAFTFDLSISGMIATLLGIIFSATAILAPRNGILAQTKLRQRDQINQAIQALIIHLEAHQNTPEEATENTISHLTAELGWSNSWTQTVMQSALAKQAITQSGQTLAPGPNSQSFWHS